MGYSYGEEDMVVEDFPPDIRCLTCWGVMSILGCIPTRNGYEECKDCAGTGIAPIPWCELNNG